jgi:TfoX/Sxy family transcriptional regulator of competence genes
MKLIKPSAGLIAEFKVVQAELREAEPRKMFGYDALFVNGNMAVGLWQNTCVLKLAAEDQAKLLSAGHATPFMPMPGRAMSSWLELSEELANDPEELLAWSRRAVSFVATLPPKARKTKTRANANAKPPATRKTAKAAIKGRKTAAGASARASSRKGVATPLHRASAGRAERQGASGRRAKARPK